MNMYRDLQTKPIIMTPIAAITVVNFISEVDSYWRLEDENICVLKGPPEPFPLNKAKHSKRSKGSQLFFTLYHSQSTQSIRHCSVKI